MTPKVRMFENYLSRFLDGTASYVSWPNLVKIGHCKVAESSSGLPHKKNLCSAGLVPAPMLPKWADQAKNSLKVVTPRHVHVYQIWSGLTVLCRTYSGKIDFRPKKSIQWLSACNKNNKLISRRDRQTSLANSYYRSNHTIIVKPYHPNILISP